MGKYRDFGIHTTYMYSSEMLSHQFWRNVCQLAFNGLRWKLKEMFSESK
jgi:hypothetical protein